MGILTNFLKLLKPEENDYYNVITEQAENWQKVDNWAKGIDDSNKNKLDKGNVSVEYDTAKKIEDKIKEVKDTADDKLNKSTYQGNAQDLKNEIDGKVSKNGDTMIGQLKIKGVRESISILNADGSVAGLLGRNYPENGIYMYNKKSEKVIDLRDDGSTKISAMNLITQEKDVVDAINGIFDNRWRITPKKIGNTDINTDLNSIYLAGFYVSSDANNKFTNKPNHITNGAFELIVTGIQPSLLAYTTQILKDYGTNKTYVRTQVTYDGSPSYPEWTEWEEISLNNAFKYLGTGTAVGRKIPVGNYSEFLVYMRYSDDIIIGIYHITKKYIEDRYTLKKFVMYGTTVIEGAFKIENGYFEVTDLGASSDGGIQVWAK